MELKWVRYYYSLSDPDTQETYMSPGPSEAMSKNNPRVYNLIQTQDNIDSILNQVTQAHYRVYIHYSHRGYVARIEIFHGQRGSRIHHEEFNQPFQYTKETIFPYINRCILLYQI